MKYRACIGNILSKSENSLYTIKNLREAGYYVVSDARETYVECDSLDTADLIDRLNFNI